jgi:hypothetical protein
MFSTFFRQLTRKQLEVQVDGTKMALNVACTRSINDADIIGSSASAIDENTIIRTKGENNCLKHVHECL